MNYKPDPWPPIGFDEREALAALAAATVKRLCLTDAERMAIELARSVFNDHYRMSPVHNAADEVLENLLNQS